MSGAGWIIGQWRRFGIMLVGFAVFAIFALLFTIFPAAYFTVLAFQGIPKVVVPFSDMAAVLQAIHCAHAGVNVYRASACMGGGVYNYSPLLLYFSVLRRGAAHLMLSGMILGGFFLLFQALLPVPAGWREFLWRALAVVSPASVFALERANIDIAIFLLAGTGVLLALRGDAARLLAYVLFCAAAALKYYPAALLVLIFGEKPRRLLALFGLLGLGGIIFLCLFGAGTLAAMKVIPRAGPLGNDFGALNIPLGFSLLLAPARITISGIQDFPLPLAAKFVMLAMTLGALAVARAGMGCYRPALQNLDAPRRLFLVAGAALICACFFIAQNLMYRGIFLLFVLPGICAMCDSAGSVRARAVWLRGIVLFLMWEEIFRIVIIRAVPLLAGSKAGYMADLVFWLLREAVWWWAVSQLLAMVFCRIEIGLDSIVQFLSGKRLDGPVKSSDEASMFTGPLQ
jgi:hypothetical protein